MVCGIARAARLASGEAVRRGVIVSRETHVYGAGVCSRCGLVVGVSHDSMMQKWAYMSYEGVSMT